MNSEQIKAIKEVLFNTQDLSVDHQFSDILDIINKNSVTGLKSGSLDRIREKFGHYFDDVNPDEYMSLFRGHGYDCTENERKFLDRLRHVGEFKKDKEGPGEYIVIEDPYRIIDTIINDIHFPGINLSELVEKKNE